MQRQFNLMFFVFIVITTIVVRVIGRMVGISEEHIPFLTVILVLGFASGYILGQLQQKIQQTKR